MVAASVTNSRPFGNRFSQVPLCSTQESFCFFDSPSDRDEFLRGPSKSASPGRTSRLVQRRIDWKHLSFHLPTNSESAFASDSFLV